MKTLARLHSVAIAGLDPLPVEIEVDVTNAQGNHLVIVGLPDTAIRESKDRTLAAIRNSSYSLSEYFCTVNLAPGDLKKEGTLYDLPIALGILLSTQKIPQNGNSEEYLIVGELGLSGETRPIKGALAMAMLARALKKKGIILPAENGREAAAVPGIDVIPINSLREAATFLQDPRSIPPLPQESLIEVEDPVQHHVDFADIKGQAHVKRAMEIAAAGAHNIVLSGPPGSGKTMLAQALASIMPEMTVEEALETTKVHSISGKLGKNKTLITSRPFRAPHHTVSYAGLIGGGHIPRPGEVSLAHNGILFLDELPEFSRTVLEVLRQPLEDRKVTISRANGHFTFPTDFICVAAMNPCPCGMLGHPTKPCKDTEAQIARYQNKISAPLWDRLDLHIEVPAISYDELLDTQTAEPSAVIRKRVSKARRRQLMRAGKTNSRLTSQDLKTYIPLDEPSREVLRYAVNSLGLSARGTDRIRRVARTIADLEGADAVSEEHLMEAIHFRQNVNASALS